MTKKRIILIEDDDVIVFLTTKLIKESENVELLNVLKNGQKAIDYFLENAVNEELLPDVIFLDLSMPILDGWQFIEAYKIVENILPKKIEIYITTSSISPQDIRKAKECGVLISDFIIKPISKQSFNDIFVG